MVLSVSRKIGDTVRNRFARIADADDLTVLAEFAGIQFVRPEDGAHDFRSACAHKSGKADNFAGAHMEADVLKDATPEKVRCAEDHLADMFVARGKQLGDGSADHQADQLGGPADRPDIRGRNTFPSAE